MVPRSPVAVLPTLDPPHFDRVARLYRWAEYLLLGPLLVRTRCALLALVRDRRHALVLGDGDGRFCAALLAACPNLTADALDSSPQMLTLLSQRCRFANHRLRVAEVDLRQLRPGFATGSPDLVVSHFVFDCFTGEELDRLLARITSILPAGAQWLVSDFAYPPRQPWRFFGQLYIRALYAAFGLLTRLQVQSLPDTSAAMQKAGYRCLRRVECLRGLLYSELWELRPSGSAQLPSPGDHPPLL